MALDPLGQGRAAGVEIIPIILLTSVTLLTISAVGARQARLAWWLAIVLPVISLPATSVAAELAVDVVMALWRPQLRERSPAHCADDHRLALGDRQHLLSRVDTTCSSNSGWATASA